MSLAAAPAAHTTTATSGPFSEAVYLALIAALVVWVIVYLVYKLVMTGKRDFGIPVKRRMLCRTLQVHEDQEAFVPFWWNDMQVQRAVRAYWRRALRSPFGDGDRAPAA